jgi:hypothetical protein
MRKHRSEYRDRTLLSIGRLARLKQLGLLDVKREPPRRIDPLSPDGKIISAEALKKLLE